MPLKKCSESELSAEVAVVHRRTAQFSLWQQRIAGDHTDASPTHAFIQALGIVTGGIEHQQCLSALACGSFGGSQQRCPQPLATCAAMHQHLRQIGAVRLILGLVEYQLHGAAQALRIVSNQQRAFTSGHALGHAAPERNRAVARQRVHEAHRRATFDAVDQYIGKFLDLRVIECVYAFYRPAGCDHRP